MEIPVIRSIPRFKPSIPKSYVVTPHIEDYPIENFDYSIMFTEFVLSGKSFILLEWDIAIEQGDLDSFELYCLKRPDIVHSVPYKVLSGDVRVWVPTNADWSWVKTDQPWAAHFGFGCTYFPIERVRKYKPNPMDTRLTDTNFSAWYYSKFGESPLHWDIKVVHLNV